MIITYQDKDYTTIRLKECLAVVILNNNSYQIDIFNFQERVELKFSDIETIKNYESVSDRFNLMKLNDGVNISYGEDYITLNGLKVYKSELDMIYESLKKGDLVNVQGNLKIDNRTLDEIMKDISSELALIKIAIQNLTDKVLPSSAQKELKTIDIYDRITTDEETAERNN